MTLKQHWQEYKNEYIVGGSCLVVGIVIGAVIFNRREVGPAMVQKVVQFAWKADARPTIEVYIEALGDPGNIIQDLTTGSVYASQGQAARELGLSPARISDHLRGRISDVQGHTFEKLGKAAVAA